MNLQKMTDTLCTLNGIFNILKMEVSHISKEIPFKGLDVFGKNVKIYCKMNVKHCEMPNNNLDEKVHRLIILDFNTYHKTSVIKPP